jgi:DNA gyrase subunit A
MRRLGALVRRRRPDPHDTPERRLARAREQLHIFEGLVVAVSDPAQVLRLVGEADDASSARRVLRRELDLDELQANAVLDLQVRRLSRHDTARIRDERDRLREVVAALERNS